MKEIWKDIIGYEGYYQISNHGRVRSLDRIISVVRGNKPHERKCKGRLLKLIREGHEPYCRYVVHLSQHGQRCVLCLAQEVFDYFSIFSVQRKRPYIKCDQTGRIYTNVIEIASDLHLGYVYLAKCIRENRSYRGYTFTKLTRGDI